MLSATLVKLWISKVILKVLMLKHFIKMLLHFYPKDRIKMGKQLK